MSPRAAWRLESMGFEQVFDYVAGKADWMGSGLTVEGSKASVPRARAVARPDVPTCSLDEYVRDVRLRVEAAGWDTCIVVNDERIVLGRLRGKALGAEPDAVVEAVMQSGPSTVRPDTELEELVERMRRRDADSALVTTSDGGLVGVVYRADAERSLTGQ